jgi:D-allose transport system ATP-binding protein
MGAGRTELMNAIFGAEKKESGSIYLNGEEVKINDTYDAVKKGLALLTENRRETGFFHNFEIYKNISTVENLKYSKLKGATGLININSEKAKAEQHKEALAIKCTSVDQNITKLSGGNQQKVIIGKWLCADAEVILFDEPTRGIDVGSKSEIYKIMRQLVDEGKGVIMVSSELPELLSVCDRILVFRKGEISARLTSAEATEEKIILAAT